MTGWLWQELEISLINKRGEMQRRRQRAGRIFRALFLEKKRFFPHLLCVTNLLIAASQPTSQSVSRIDYFELTFQMMMMMMMMQLSFPFRSPQVWQRCRMHFFSTRSDHYKKGDKNETGSGSGGNYFLIRI